jgi:hypothetical protein
VRRTPVNRLDTYDTFVFGLMGQHWSANHIADCV